MVYHRLHHDQAKRLKRRREELDDRQRRAQESSERRAALSSLRSSASVHTPRERGHTRHRSRLDEMPEGSSREATQSLESSFNTVDTNGCVLPRTPQDAAMALATYLLTTQPQDDDPRAQLHRQMIRGVGMLGNALQTAGSPTTAVEPAHPPPRREHHREVSPRHHVEPRQEYPTMIVRDRRAQETVDRNRRACGEDRSMAPRVVVERNRTGHEENRRDRKSVV